MKHIITLAFLALTFSLTSCHDVEDYDNTAQGNFEALWQIINDHYCFLLDKNVDWDEVHQRYAAKMGSKMTSRELFDLLSDMLAELKDGHTNLSSPFATSYYHQWWSDYPQNYDARLIEQYYFNFNYISIGSAIYGLLPDNVGYLHYSSFASGLGDGNIDYILDYFRGAKALIFDVRDNGGGNLTNVEDFVNRFIDKKITAGYIIHKTGPGHNDFSEPYEFHYEPVGGNHIAWTKPVIVLTNRSTFSAANNFVSIMKSLPNVRIVGSTTGGGSGMPFNSELPNGWSVRFSACSILDPERKVTEFGIEPSEGCAIDMNQQDAANGHDTILDFALWLVNGQAAS